MPEVEIGLRDIPRATIAKSLFPRPLDAKATLQQKMVAGGAWSFALKGVEQVFILARLIILARILAPGDFGLLGIALIMMSALDVLSQTGFQQALIHNKGDIRSYLSISWTVLAARGFVLFFIILIIAPYVAGFFGIPEAQPILQVIGLSMIFRGLTNPGVVYFLKEMDFKKQFFYSFSGTVADFSVAIGAVFVLHNVWALVLGWLAKDFVTLVASYLVHPYRPRVEFELTKAKGLYRFGIWVFTLSALTFLVTQGDDIFVGKLLGATALGLYQMAYGLSSAPATEIATVISQVAFPAYSKLQDDLRELRRTFARTLKFMLLLATPLAGAIFILAPQFVIVFLGDKWAGLIPAMQILAWWGFMRAVIESANPLFWALGKPRVTAMLQFVQLILLFALIYPLVLYADITGAALAVIISAIPVFLIINKTLISTLQMSTADYYQMVFYPLVMTLVSFIPVAIVRFVSPTPGLLTFLIMTATYALSFLIAGTIIDRRTSYSVWRFLREESGTIRSEAKAEEGA